MAPAHVEAALRVDTSEHPSISKGRYAICSPEKFNYHFVGEIIREEWTEEELPAGEGIPSFKNHFLDGAPATRDS